MSFLSVNFSSESNALESFNRIANELANNIILKINDAKYRIVDCEFYAYSPVLPDPHTYKHSLQLQQGKLYLHGSGIDITCGNGESYGGILLRSVVRLYNGSDSSTGFMQAQFDGPQIVATELLSNLNTLTDGGKNEIVLEDIQGQNQTASFYGAKRVLKTKRVGLTPKKDDPDNHYLNLSLRYITVLPKFSNSSKFKQTIKGIETILREHVAEGLMTKEEAQDIVGYQLKF
ncbi:MAG: hypothetical protein FGM54_04300 [Chitinophagaceae bacterium]|nr:hypothetical protein [Chitinophagaceae bacterium]